MSEDPRIDRAHAFLGGPSLTTDAELRALTPDQLEKCVHRALEARDIQAVEGYLMLMAVKDPHRAAASFLAEEIAQVRAEREEPPMTTTTSVPATGPRDRSRPDLEPIIRPNGKIYRPRKIRAVYCENPYGRRNDVFVLGTHDLIGALEPAAAEVRYRLGGPYFLLDAVGEIGWWREMVQRGERVVIADDVRGAAGIRFEVEER